MENRYINGKYDAVDLVKFISCILVIAIHVKPFGNEESILNFFFKNYVSRVAVPLFFVFTGYFLFKDNIAQFKIKHQLSKLIKIYLIWSLIYAPMQIKGLAQYTDNGFKLFAFYIRDFFLTGSYYHLWYFPAIIFGIFFLYELKRFLKIRTIAGIAIGLYLIGLLGQSWYGLVEVLHISAVQKIINLILSVCKTTRNGLFEGFPFIVLGMLVNHVRLKSNREKNMMLLSAIISFALVGVEIFTLDNVNFIHEYDYCLMMFPTIFFFSCYIVNTQISIGNTGIIFRNMSTLVYLLHILIYEVSKNVLAENGLGDVQFFIITVVVLLISNIIVSLSAKFKCLAVLYTGSINLKR